MKRILTAILVLCICFLSSVCFFFTPLTKVNADEETTPEINEEEVIPEEEDKPTDTDGELTQPDEELTPGVDSSVNSQPLTKEELIEIINAALTEQQKQFTDNIAGKIATALGIDYNTVYLIVAALLIIAIIIILLLTKYLSSKGTVKSLKTQLTAQQSAYSVLAESKDDLSNLLNNLTVDELKKTLGDVLKLSSGAIVSDTAEKIVAKLKIDDLTISELAANGKIILETATALKEALIAIAENNRDLAIQRLSESPTAEVVNSLELENKKLKAALGDEAVVKALSETTTSDTTADNV